ncbi:MAG: RAMP superfamily CRISPR-associated protein [Patescibacteria group bacterium]|nr:RAMP superfamily CRISPR-associated protein [Patescibacteria group bacterium]
MKKKFALRLRTLTPLHIFSGNYFYDYEFFISNDSLYLVDFDGLFSRKSLRAELFRIIDTFFHSQGRSKGDDSFIQEIQSFYQSNSKYLEKENLIRNRLDLRLKEEEKYRLRTANIQKFMDYLDITTNKKEVFIPGSSIKGAFFDLLSRYLNLSDKMKLQELRSKIGFSDFYFKEKSSWIEKIKRIGVNNGQRKQGPSIMVQLVDGTAEGEIFFQTDTSVNNFDIESFLEKFFLEGGKIVLRKKRKFNRPYSQNFSQELIEKIKTSKALIMLLGFGSLSVERDQIIRDLHGKTIIVDHKHPKTYFSHNFRDPLGVVSLEIVN